MAIPLTRRRFSVDEYYRMAAAGIFTEDDRVELIEGEVVQMVPIGDRHAAHVDKLVWVFSRRVGDQAIIRVQNPLRLGSHSEPQPDVVLLRPRADFYTGGHPGPQDALLVVEVADTMLDYDRGIKIPLYARHGVPEVWLVDLQRRVVEVFSARAPDGYRIIQTHRLGERLSASALPGVVIAVEDLFISTR